MLPSPVIRDENSVPMHSFDSILYGGGRTRVQSKAALEDSVVIFLQKSTLMMKWVVCVTKQVLADLVVRAVLLEGEAEVVEDAGLGGDALGAGRLVPQPRQRAAALLPHRGRVRRVTRSCVWKYFSEKILF